MKQLRLTGCRWERRLYNKEQNTRHPRSSLRIHGKAKLVGISGTETYQERWGYLSNALFPIYRKLPAAERREDAGLLCHDLLSVGMFCGLKENGMSASWGFHSTAAIGSQWKRLMLRPRVCHCRSCYWQLYLEKRNLIAVRYRWYFWHPSSISHFQSLLRDVKQNCFCIHFAFVITPVKRMMYEHFLFSERQPINFIMPVEKFGDGVTKHLMIKENSE